MPEALTESFCERCGTRYEFTAPTRLNPLRKTRGLVSGLKNYIMSQDALGDAVGDAMRSEQDALAAAQLDAFHTSFNFCIDCRQYTCVSCWNDDAGRCRSCAPIAGTDDLAERLAAGISGSATNGQAEVVPQLGVEAWPTADLDEVRADDSAPAEELAVAASFEPEPALEPETRPAVAAQPFEAAAPSEPIIEYAASLERDLDLQREVVAELPPEPVPYAEAEPSVEAELPLEPDLPVEAELPVEPEVVAETDEHAAAVLAWDADETFELIQFPTPTVEDQPSIEFAAAPEVSTEEQAWSYEDEAPAYENAPSLSWAAAPDLSLVDAELDATQPEPEVAGPVQEPDVAASAPDVAPAAALPPAEPAAPPALRPMPHVAAQPAAPEPVAASAAPPETPEIDDPVVAARRAQLDLLGLGEPDAGARLDGPRPLPYRSSGASLHPAELAARLAAQQQGNPAPIGAQSAAQTIRASMWDASAAEVAGAQSAVGVQNCGGCGLSLSATARFCRRCGTRQAQPA